MLHLKGNTFVMFNSMAFEGDHCSMCKETEAELQNIALSLNCARVSFCDIIDEGLV